MAAAAFTFNTDLLLNDKDKEFARTRYPSIFPTIYNEALLNTFRPIDLKANDAKRRARKWGIIAICLVSFSLILGAIELVPHQVHALPPPVVILAAAAGLAGAVIGWFGLMFARSKREWLYNRYLTERLRQLHFQSLVCWAGEIARGSDPAVSDALAEKQRLALARFHKENIEIGTAAKDVILKSVIRDELPVWLVDHGEGDGVAANPVFDELVSFYDLARFSHQAKYAEEKLREDNAIFSSQPKRQSKIISRFSWLCVLGLMLLHVAVLATSFLEVSEFQSLIHLAAICIGISALAVRTLEEGLQPTREVERYRQYSSALKLADKEFKNAATVPAKLKAMKRLEELSVEEMVNFIKTNNEARFVM